MGRGEKRNRRVRREEEQLVSGERNRRRGKKRNRRVGLKIKMARIQRRFVHFILISLFAELLDCII